MLLWPTTEQLTLSPDAPGDAWRLCAPFSARLFHRHAELEVNLVLRGQATYIVERERVRLVRRSLLWLHPNQHHILIETSSDFEMALVLWKPEFLALACQDASSQILLRGDPGEVRVRRVSEDDFGFLESLHARLQSAAHDGFVWSLGHFLHAAHEAHERAPQNGQGQEVHPCVERAARLLRDLVPPPDVPTLARQVGLSPSRLSRLFKLQTGVSLGEFRARSCHERALRLLESDLPLSEVAAQAGFGSYAQFHRVFCARSHVNPAKWKKERQVAR